MAFTTLGVIILWFGWFGFNAGSTLSVQLGGLGFFTYVALNTNLAAAAGVIGAVVTSMVVMKKPDLSMMLNGAIAALVAITAACAFVAPWGALVIGFGAGAIVVFGSRLVERARIDDPVERDRGARHGGRLGHARARLPRGAEPGRAARDRPRRPPVHGLAAPAGTQALGLLAVGVFTFGASFLVLWTMKATFGIRTDAEAETAGLDVSEHGIVGLPGVLQPGSGRVRDGSARPVRRRSRPQLLLESVPRRCPSRPNARRLSTVPR